MILDSSTPIGSIGMPKVTSETELRTLLPRGLG
jgi:hypothetical protein